MSKIFINCDVGEGLNNEELLMPYIQSCNIACGGHAGNKQSMQKVVRLAVKHNVKIGAHPSYPDLQNFGRKTLSINSDEFKKSIQNQINSLVEVLKSEAGTLHHIKPHGALYNDIAKNNELSILFLEAILPFKTKVKLYVPYHSQIEKNALKQGFKIEYEAFADRNYNEDLSLVSRDRLNAVITNINQIVNHVIEIKNQNLVTTILGTKKEIKASTFCVHSDTENAVEIVKKLSQIII